MKNWLHNLSMKYIRFMQGRYGMYGMDDLNRTASWFVVILDLVGIIFNLPVLVYLSLVFLVMIMFRIYSKNIVKRTMENTKFRELTGGIRHYGMAMKKNRDDPSHKYFVCPSCHQLVRVPSGRGKIEITCPKCRKMFTRKS